MWFASIWIFTLRLPWELGADFFLRHLLDGDPASNTLSWRWVGGLQTPGKTYLAGPTTSTPIPAAASARAASRRKPCRSAARPRPRPGRSRTPASSIRRAPSVLLLHEDDLSPHVVPARGVRLVGTALMAAPEGRSPLAVSPAVCIFVRQAVEAAAALQADRLGPIRPLAQPDTVEALLSWAEAQGASQIVTPYAPVGPMATRLAEVERACHARGLTLVRCLRDEDRALWPLATHGFFRFWEAIGRS